MVAKPTKITIFWSNQEILKCLLTIRIGFCCKNRIDGIFLIRVGPNEVHLEDEGFSSGLDGEDKSISDNWVGK